MPPSDPIFVASTPGQSGEGRLKSAGLTWDSGNWVPTSAEAVTITKQANVQRTADGSDDVAHMTTSGHHLVASGEFCFTDDVGTTIPEIGLVVEDSEGRKWVVVDPVPVVSFTATHKPVKATLTMEFHPKVSVGEGGTDGSLVA